MSSKRVGALILEEEISQGETLGYLLARLANADHEAWQQVFDTRTDSIRPFIMTIFNGTLLPLSEALQTRLSDGDQIALRVGYAGG